MKIFLDFQKEKQLRQQMNKASHKVKRELQGLTKEAQYVLLKKAVEHASGSPGPNVVTGQYISAFSTKIVSEDRNGFIIGLSNPSPQAARLEYGYFGVDSMGRNISQPARPHFRPALLETREWYFEEVNRIVEHALV
jgi:hypothetical protein